MPTTEGPPSVVQPVVPAAPRTEPFAPTPELKVLPAPPPGQRFRPYVPIYDLAAAAGGFSGTQIPEPLGWAKAPRYRAVDPFMFIARVVGRSMEPLIPDGAWCLFRRAQPGSRNNKIVLVQCRDFTDPETGGSYTVKRYRSEKARTWDGSWRHTVIRLEPINPEFPPIVFRSGADIHVVAELLQVLTPEDY
ncbi:putative phage repressor [Acidothermus cellulolyticus 11B]|uniref:Putative phage repressor n=1 Tax=Acidothermus cellulolyticus (strain ATCC 43068 / DSM 8971 / 11B) TaxID=351607 RepID=A0LUM6_ACIC1|nr:S24 family peptidase [Acidothermus cellulolyticus]ABK53136.1 putative phage repressor [Acidothermus cellulolyticus 11B]